MELDHGEELTPYQPETWGDLIYTLGLESRLGAGIRVPSNIQRCWNSHQFYYYDQSWVLG